MDRTANIIAAYADQVLKDAGSHLSFEFQEYNYTIRGRFHRRRCVDPNFRLTPSLKLQLTLWISSPDWPNPQRIRLADGLTQMMVVWQPSVVRQFRVFCRMPAVAYDLEDNPIYKALKKKSGQVRHAKRGQLRCIFLVDAGCDLLRRLQPMSSIHEVGGVQIIRHALSKLNIDVVCVFSPYREPNFGFNPEKSLVWNVTYFDKRHRVSPNEYDRLRDAASKLPRPRYEGYQARDQHIQNGFNPQKSGQYLGNEIITHFAESKVIVKISSRLALEYLAGRIDNNRFQNLAFGDRNIFQQELFRGNTISSIHLEKA